MGEGIKKSKEATNGEKCKNKKTVRIEHTVDTWKFVILLLDSRM